MQITLAFGARANDPRASVPCRFYALGKCNKGAACLFSHLDQEVQDTNGPSQPATDSRAQLPCAFFARGACRNGEKCAYAHETAAGTATTETVDVLEVGIYSKQEFIRH
jgi:hypothetical protein